MINLISGLSLDRILNDISQASPEFKQYIDIKGDLAEARGFEKTVHMFPDTQLFSTDLPVFLAFQERERTRSGKKPKVDVEALTITREELMQNGLKRYDVIPVELYRGENSLLKRCQNLPSWANGEIRSFYDIATASFEELIHGLFAFQDISQGNPGGLVAQAYMSDRKMKFPNGTQQAYHAMFTKLLQKRSKGNEFNYIADKILGLTNFGVNFFSYNDISVVLTADGDFKAIEHFIYNKVLPRYIAESARKTVEQHAPGRWTNLGITENGLAKLENWAREHIPAGLEANPSDYRQLTNVIYNCQNGEIYTGYVHPRIKDFVFDKSVGLAKAYVAEKSIRDRVSVAKVLSMLEKDSSSYKIWLNEMSRARGLEN
jgi:hypothetical protein